MHRLVLLQLGLLGLLGAAGFSGLLPADQPGAGSGSGGFVALAAGLAVLLVTLAVTGTLLSTAGAASPQAVRSTAVRRRAWRSAFLPQRDPDARGRCRPRAPGRARTAA